jgi:hypothetical protein
MSSETYKDGLNEAGDAGYTVVNDCGKLNVSCERNSRGISGNRV